MRHGWCSSMVCRHLPPQIGWGLAVLESLTFFVAAAEVLRWPSEQQEDAGAGPRHQNPQWTPK